jgi:hypothetical protein
MRNCDLIMKCGITSGVVFPLAIVELSKEFRFKNVGGTSAGAIAAALTAAAEYQRVESGNPDGFNQLAMLPAFLGGSSANGNPNLLNLFPPAKKTRRLFGVLTAFLGHSAIGARIVRAIVAMFGVNPLATVACFIPFLFAIYLAVSGQVPGYVAFLSLLFFFVFGVVLLALVTAAVGALSKPPDRDLPGVTDWLADEIQKTAGLASGSNPLTFGDLENAGINLVMMTTGLSHGRPYRLPFQTRIFAFNEGEFRRYFPGSIVDFMIDAARKQAALGSEPEINDPLVAASDALPSADDRYYPLPPAHDLPIVVCARMSLSFPILFQLVPLYAIDHASKNQERKRCWFIDGGLSSNFPINLFDSPLPRWPTFGIDLTGEHPDHKIDDSNPDTGVWMVNDNRAGLAEHWLSFGSDGRSIVGYVSAILDAIRNWHDNLQMSVPGYRDRIAHVKLRTDEGGLNLSMSQDKVAHLTQRGQQAGLMLCKRFGNPGAAETMNWNNHRWIRFKTTVPLFRKALIEMQTAYAPPATPDTPDTPAAPDYPDYPALTRRNANDPETGYWWRSPANAKAYLTATDELLKAGAGVTALVDAAFEAEAPLPQPELRVSPRV